MNKELFKVLIKEGQEDILGVSLNERLYDFEEEGRYVLVGIRQAGKSYMMYQHAKRFLDKGYDISRIVYINFDDERLLGMTADDFDLILQAYWTMSQSEPLLFFDEIQRVSGWEHFARRLANRKYHVFITGSNAKMLSKDIATTLGGRYFEEKVYPYSFLEYLQAQGVELDDAWQYGKKKNVVQRYFSEYFLWGGFPELQLYKNKRHWLNSLYEKIVLGDVIQRNNIKNEHVLRFAVKRLAENILQPLSYNRLANIVKSAGVSTNTASVIEYIRYVKESCLMFTLDNFASKFAERETSKKHYFTDNGLLSIFLSEEKAPRLENICAIALQKKYNGDDDSPGVYFYNKNVEVDFYIPDENRAVQVAYSIESYETRNREVSALVSFNGKYRLEKAEIVTFDEEGEITEGTLKIKVTPVWRWLLESV